jgi:hypothetical protein
MGHVPKPAALDELRHEIARIEGEPAFDFGSPRAPKPEQSYDEIVPLDPEPLPDELPPVAGQFDDIAPAERDARQPFGQWLLAQGKHKGWIADLAKWAKSDPRFPKGGSPDDVRKRLTDINAEGDAFEALDDAEMDWMSY